MPAAGRTASDASPARRSIDARPAPRRPRPPLEPGVGAGPRAGSGPSGRPAGSPNTDIELSSTAITSKPRSCRSARRALRLDLRGRRTRRSARASRRGAQVAASLQPGGASAAGPAGAAGGPRQWTETSRRSRRARGALGLPGSSPSRGHEGHLVALLRPTSSAWSSIGIAPAPSPGGGTSGVTRQDPHHAAAPPRRLGHRGRNLASAPANMRPMRAVLMAPGLLQSRARNGTPATGSSPRP